jgi:hypothetical protein
MSTIRDETRAARTDLYNTAMKSGITMDVERSKTGSDQQVLMYEAGKLLNSATPRIDREQLVVESPPLVGTFDGGNTAFTLGQVVKGLNIGVSWGSTAENTTWPLTRTNANPPGNHSFFFDPASPTQIVVGNPPLDTDRLIVTYLVER